MPAISIIIIFLFLYIISTVIYHIPLLDYKEAKQDYTEQLASEERADQLKAMAFQASAQTHAFVERSTEYAFVDGVLLLHAIDASGMYRTDSNKRLALLGDAVLRQVILDDWYITGATIGTGQSRVSSIASNSNLARVGRAAGLDDYIVRNAGHIGSVSDKIIATAVEALLGAIYLDSGKDLEVFRTVMTALGL